MRSLRYRACTPAALAIGLSWASSVHASPQLYPDKWVEITPPQVQTGGPETCIGQGIIVDPQNPSTVYWGTTPYTTEAGGLFKTEDGGSNWTRIGAVTKAFPEASDHLDMPLHVRINPNDPKHLYAGDGVRGGSMGFFISHDAGLTFEIPQSFKDTLKAAEIDNQDIYDVAVDPSNFDHVLLTWHYRWGWDETKWKRNAGILESRDGGGTWIVHNPVPGVGGAGHSIKFLYSPDLKVGDSDTWLLGAQDGGYHRTADAGKTWTKVSETNISHGGSDIYYSKSGWLYTSGQEATMRSNDNGITWEAVGASTTWTVGGDGDRLYTGKSFGAAQPMQVSADGDGVTWTDFNDQIFPDGPYAMAYDQYYGILYSSNWSSGVWALKANAGSGKVPPLTKPRPLDPVGMTGGSAGSGGGPASSPGGVGSVSGNGGADAGVMSAASPGSGGCACWAGKGRHGNLSMVPAAFLAGLSLLRRRSSPARR